MNYTNFDKMKKISQRVILIYIKKGEKNSKIYKFRK